MKFMSSLLIITLAASSAFAGTARVPAQESRTNAQKTLELLNLQKELSSLEAQLKNLREDLDSNTKTRNRSLILSGALVLATGAIFMKVNSPKTDMVGLGLGVLLGGSTAAGAIGTAAGGGLMHYQVIVNREDIVRLEAKISRIQTKLSAKLSQLED